MKGQSSRFPFSCTKTTTVTLWGTGWGCWGEIQRTIWFLKSQTTCKQLLTQVLPWESQPEHFHWHFMYDVSSDFAFHNTTNTAMLFIDCIYTIKHRNIILMGWYIPSPVLQAQWWTNKVQSCSQGQWLCFFHPVSTHLVGSVGNFNKHNFCAEM